MRILMTKFVKKAEVTSSWFEIDAKNAVVGRLASVSFQKSLEEKTKILLLHIWIMEILLLLKILK